MCVFVCVVSLSRSTTTLLIAGIEAGVFLVVISKITLWQLVRVITSEIGGKLSMVESTSVDNTRNWGRDQASKDTTTLQTHITCVPLHVNDLRL